VWEGRALSHNRTTPYALTSGVAKRISRILAHDSLEQAREKVVTTVEAVAPDLKSDLLLLFDFLGLSESSADVLRLDPTIRRKRLFRTTTRLFGRALPAYNNFPNSLILLEDLQWVDAGSASMLEAYFETLPGTRTLVIVNTRPGF